jgi:signal peptidase II
VAKKKPQAAEPPAPPPRGKQAILIFAVAAILLTVLDLATKEWALEALSVARPGEPPPICETDELGRVHYQRIGDEPVVVIDGLMEFRYAENCGAAFGIMRDAPSLARRAVFGVAAVVAGIALTLMFVRGRGGILFAYSAPMIVAGAIGNLSDRVRHGFVVDFIRFHSLPLIGEYPTFNVADIYITVGVVLLVVDGFREERRAKAAARAAQGAPATD